MTWKDCGSMLLTGSTGYLGGMIAAAMLSQNNCRLVTPVRIGHTRESIIEKIKSELPANIPAAEIDFDRLIVLPLSTGAEDQSLAAAMHKYDVDQIVHCAGSVEYFDSERLKEGNIDLTAQLISLGEKQQIRRFIHLSTAFSSGYVDGLIHETAHTSPKSDPTEYTKSKRDSEDLIINSSLPYLIVRPSIVIGDSRDGRYSGKAYGLYQFWTAYEKFLCDRYREVLHQIAPQVKLQIVHQDAFLAAFLSAYSNLPDNSIIHIVSKDSTLPTSREVAQLWNEGCTRPREAHYYERLSDVPMDGLDRRIKMWLEFTEVNSDIAAHSWQFETKVLDNLRANGLRFTDATIDTLRICQERFIAQSPRLQAFSEKNKQQLAAASCSK